MTKVERNFGFMRFGASLSFYCSKNHGYLFGDDHQLFPIDSKEDFLEFMSGWFDECELLVKQHGNKK